MRRPCPFLLMAALVGVGLLPIGGCNGNGGGKPKERTSSTLRVWQTETDKGARAVLDEVVKEFETNHPGVSVQLESVAWSTLSQKLATAIQTGSEPDLAHLEPFMVRALIEQDRLLPLDDVVSDLEKANGPMEACVRDLQLYEGKRYGIAYALGVTGWAYRKDVADRLKLAEPKTWNQYVSFVKAIAEDRVTDGRLRVLLPGGDPFFVDQLLAELVANAGGRLFNPDTFEPELASPQMVAALQFLSALRPYVVDGWQMQNYLDQFTRLARGEAGNAPVTYVRAFRTIESVAKDASAVPGPRPDQATFALLKQPVWDQVAGRASVSTLDCEPYVVFRKALDREAPSDVTNADLAKDFLRLFFDRKHYLRFCRAVPIHLTPIFSKLANDPEYAASPEITRWSQWAEHAKTAISQNRVRPILMPDDGSHHLPFLLEVQADRVLTDMVADVMNGTSAGEAAKNGQTRATRLIARLGYGRKR